MHYSNMIDRERHPQEALDLVFRLLHPTPNMRIDLEEVCASSWINGAPDTPSETLINEMRYILETPLPKKG